MTRNDGTDREADERLALVQGYLAEVGEALAKATIASATLAVLLRNRLAELELRIRAWERTPPSRIQRAAMVNDVLALRLDVVKASREGRER